MINTNEEILETCILNGITINQYFILYMIASKGFTRPYVQSTTKQYIDKIGPFSPKDIERLVDMGYVEDLNKDGEFRPESYLLNDKTLKIFLDIDLAEDLWNKYPATLPLNNGKKFLSRAGDKDEILKDYQKRINYSTVQHRNVIRCLDTYVSLVKSNKINGHKIGDFVKMELWNTIDEIAEQDNKEQFGRDI